jgi:uncharacterized protein (UPF0332 family)
MDIDECIKKRLLRKIEPNQNKSDSSVKTAEMKLEEAKQLFASEFFNSSVISAYTSMFHIARALLYSEGFQEKSHYAVYIYLKEMYSDKISLSLINSFFNYQSQRHAVLYELEYQAASKDVENLILDAEEFLYKVKELLS